MNLLDRILMPTIKQAMTSALRQAAEEAERDARECPEGCSDLYCMESNLKTAAWLRGRAARIEESA